MPADSLFKRLPIKESTPVKIFINGQEVLAQPNDSIASAILLSGVNVNRKTPVSGKKRAPYCMMGVCFDCLVNINGEENIQACMTKVEENMDIHTQDGAKHLDTERNVGDLT